ncbi:MAG: ROK family protein [Victivallales bacterium]|nr:ROK family protein [Victivallales bacterium]
MKTAANEFYAALDVGGTFIKYALVSSDMEIITPVKAEAVPSLENADKIMAAFYHVTEKLTQAAIGKDGVITQVCVAICGPMDYEHGIFQMNEDKYTAVYGVDLKQQLREFLGNNKLSVSTHHDVRAFLLGNSVIEPALRKGKVMAITLGTGIGSAFMKNGRILQPGDGIPEKGLGRQPYGTGKVEDVIGAEALRRMYPGAGFTVKELEAMARNGDEAALAVFRKLGLVLGESASAFVELFHPDIIILGGQISRAAKLIMPEFRRYIDIEVRCVPDMERAAMLGAVAAGVIF